MKVINKYKLGVNTIIIGYLGLQIGPVATQRLEGTSYSECWRAFNLKLRNMLLAGARFSGDEAALECPCRLPITGLA